MATISSSSSTFMGNALGPNSSGCFDWVLSDLDADNAFALTITDANTITSGYMQGIYVSQTVTGTYTTGSMQINAIAIDQYIGGTTSVEVAGLYIYQAASGTPTSVASGNFNGIVIYLDDLDGAPAYRAGVKVYSDAASSAISASLDAAFVAVSANQGNFGGLLGYKGTTFPDYFFWSQNDFADGKMCRATFAPTAVPESGLKVLFGSTAYILPLYASTSGS